MGGSEDEFWEDGHNFLPSVSGRSHPVGGVIQAADEGRGIIIPVEAASESTVFRVLGVYGDGVSGSPPIDSAQEGAGRETALGYHGP